jgi:hypothetical protein
MGLKDCNDLIERYPSYLASKALDILERFEYIISLPNSVYFLFSRLSDEEPFNKTIKTIERNNIKRRNLITRVFEFEKLPNGIIFIKSLYK